jgi:hypothetical protein
LGLVETDRVAPLLGEPAEIGRMLRGLASSVARSRAARRSCP